MIQVFKWSFHDDLVESVIGAILRTPGLILCDYWHQKCLDFSVPRSFELTDLADASLHIAVLFLGFLILLLPYAQLVDFYMHLMSGTLLILAEIMSRVYVEEELAIAESPTKSQLLWSSAYYRRQVMQAMSCITVSVVTAWCIGFKNPVMKWLPNVYLFPMVVRLLDYPMNLLPLALKISTFALLTFVALYLVYKLPSIFRMALVALEAWQMVSLLYGNFHALVLTMSRLFDPAQFIIYWVALFFSQLWQEYTKFQEQDMALVDVGDWYIFLLLVICKICYSPLTLIANCLAVMFSANAIITITNAYLDSCKSHAPPSTAVLSGLTEGMVMFLLSLQTGLIDLELAQRLGAMSIILFIVAASLFQTVLEITHPVLLALSASSRNIWSHIKVLALCCVLCVIPAYMSHLLLSTVDLDIWTMVVISSSILTSIQVIGHFVHYLLYLYDSLRSDPLEPLDDYVYYLKSAVHALELMSALFVVCAGLKEVSTGQWSVITCGVLVVHCYFNVWLRIKSGWQTFLSRQAAVSRILTLVDATKEELIQHNDVCAICYCEMNVAAKITPCSHFFHGGCLKKWLFVQDHCPMCSAKIIEEEATEENEVEEEEIIVANEEEEEEEDQL